MEVARGAHASGRGSAMSLTLHLGQVLTAAVLSVPGSTARLLQNHTAKKDTLESLTRGRALLPPLQGESGPGEESAPGSLLLLPGQPSPTPLQPSSKVLTPGAPSIPKSVLPQE